MPQLKSGPMYRCQCRRRLPRGTVFVHHYNYSTHPLPPLQVTLKGHVVAAFMNHYNMKTMDDNFPQHILCSLMQATMAERKVHFHKLVHKILQNVVRLPENPGSLASHDHQDGVFNYACELLTYCLLHAEFNDAIHEGGGIRIITCWKFFYYSSVQHTAQNMHWNPLQF